MKRILYRSSVTCATFPVFIFKKHNLSKFSTIFVFVFNCRFQTHGRHEQTQRTEDIADLVRPIYTVQYVRTI